MSEEQRTAKTYFYELWRAGASGILETAGITFLLLIAVQGYAAGPIAKGLVAGAGSLGLLISPLVVSVVTSEGWPTSKAAARLLILGALSFCIAAISHNLALFVVGSVVGLAASAAIVPLLTQMYQENYPKAERGKRFARTIMVRIAMAAAFSKVAGDALNNNFSFFPILLCVFGAASAFAGFCLWQCPTRPIVADGSSHPLRGWRFVREDRLFRQTLICWMLMGFANLMMIPLRVEYLANRDYHIQLSIGTIALLTGVIPNLARLLVSPIWGHLFDQMNFFSLRVVLNIGFAIGILAFFMTGSMTGMICGAIVFGISNAGGDVAWSLWVTKFAPPERVADYMSIHTFFTGVRGVLAPLVAFALATPKSIGWIAFLSISLIIAATLMLLPELKFGRKAEAKNAFVEEIVD